MKTILLVLAAALPLGAQVVNPATGKKFETRTINGNDGNNGVSINGSTTPPLPPKAKLVSYFSLSETRQWKSSDGRSLLGSIIAFEESVIEIDVASPAAAKEAAQKAPPAKLPEKPTLIRGGKIRLLVNNKPFEIALELLSGEDRKFVEDLNSRLPK